MWRAAEMKDLPEPGEPWAKKAATKKAGTGKKKAASKAAKRSSRSTRGRT